MPSLNPISGAAISAAGQPAAPSPPVTNPRSTNQNVAGGAIPVWLADGPSYKDGYPGYPNDQSMTTAGIPVFFVSAPTGYSRNNQQTTDGGPGAIPVRVVARPTPAARYSNDQSSDAGAIPVWEDTRLALGDGNNQAEVGYAIPVWRVN